MGVPDWVMQAAQLPVAFAQVREDPLVDLAVLEHLTVGAGPRPGRGLTAMMIASGGCTAAFLAASVRFSHLHLVDFNPAQMELCRVKLHLLQAVDPSARLRQLGHAPVDETKPDYLGRYEILFAVLQEKMRKVRDELTAMLMLDDPVERSARVAPNTPLGKVFDEAFDEVMALPNLVQLFGVQATQNSRLPFSRHFAERTRHAIAALPTANNPYLWQLLLGRFPDGVSYPWFTVAPPARMPEIVESVGTIDSALAGHHDRFDFIHLSNVLDWLSITQARHTLSLAFHALRSGGCIIIRQLNSTLDLPALGDQFNWLKDLADRLHASDRSFFYSSLHLGSKG